MSNIISPRRRLRPKARAYRVSNITAPRRPFRIIDCAHQVSKITNSRRRFRIAGLAYRVSNIIAPKRLRRTVACVEGRGFVSWLAWIIGYALRSDFPGPLRSVGGGGG